jgi:hypothetical protein
VAVLIESSVKSSNVISVSHHHCPICINFVVLHKFL